jgi:hypothetical protein
MFLKTFLVNLVEQSRDKGIPHINLRHSNNQDLRLFGDGHIEKCDLCRHSPPNYLISDNVDICDAYGSGLNILVSSEIDIRIIKLLLKESKKLD